MLRVICNDYHFKCLFGCLCTCTSSALLDVTTVHFQTAPTLWFRQNVCEHPFPFPPRRLGTVRLFNWYDWNKKGGPLIPVSKVCIYLGNQGSGLLEAVGAGSGQTEETGQGLSSPPIPISGKDALDNTETASTEVTPRDLLHLSVVKYCQFLGKK